MVIMERTKKFIKESGLNSLWGSQHFLIKMPNHSEAGALADGGL